MFRAYSIAPMMIVFYVTLMVCTIGTQGIFFRLDSQFSGNSYNGFLVNDTAYENMLSSVTVIRQSAMRIVADKSPISRISSWTKAFSWIGETIENSVSISKYSSWPQYRKQLHEVYTLWKLQDVVGRFLGGPFDSVSSYVDEGEISQCSSTREDHEEVALSVSFVDELSVQCYNNVKPCIVTVRIRELPSWRKVAGEDVYGHLGTKLYSKPVLCIEFVYSKFVELSSFVTKRCSMSRNLSELLLSHLGESAFFCFWGVASEPLGFICSSSEWFALAMTFSLAGALTMLLYTFGDAVPTSADPIGSLEKQCSTADDLSAKPESGAKRAYVSKSWLPRLAASTGVLLFLGVTASADTNLRQNITDGVVPCLQYDKQKALFQMTCDELKWEADTYISIGANETFDGERAKTPNGKGVIDLTGVANFKGIFTVDSTDIESFAEAPIIRNVHVKNGLTGENGGFIVQSSQKYFIVDTCSSTGDIKRNFGGGICGWRGGYEGEMKIINSFSTGNVDGNGAGGITGRAVGKNGRAHILKCNSTGNITGDWAGAICGDAAGFSGKLNITQSYSTGDLLGKGSGGITGGSVGYIAGYVYIQECYSTGKISGDDSGGVCGDQPSHSNGEVHIVNCYSRGVIQGEYSGGILGTETGAFTGEVYIENTYASGNIEHANAGGLIGGLATSSGIVDVKYSVYNHDSSNIVGAGSSVTRSIDNSYNLNDILGKLYAVDGARNWSNDTWSINGTDTLPILRFQLGTREQHRPTATPSSTTTGTRSPSRSRSPSVTPTGTASPSSTSTPTASRTNSPSVTRTITPSSTHSSTPTPSKSASCSVTQIPTSSPTTTSTPTPTKSRSPSGTPTSTPSATGTRTPTMSASPSATPTPTPSKSPRRLIIKKELPVQRPARSVRTSSQSRSQNGRRRNTM